MVDAPDDDSSSRGGEVFEPRQQIEGQQFDIASYIQAEIAKCMTNYGNQNQNGATTRPRTYVNFVHEGKKDGTFFDGRYAFSIVPSMEHTTWIINSGASTHVCCDREMLHTVYMLNKSVTIHLPHGASRQVTFAGHVKLNKYIVFENILFVPGFTHNLLSVA